MNPLILAIIFAILGGAILIGFAMHVAPRAPQRSISRPIERRARPLPYVPVALRAPARIPWRRA